MSKYLRKVKVSSEVAVMDVAASPLGVRTRACTLALQRLQKQQVQGEEGAGREYLELRSRRLEKLPPSAAATRRCGGRKGAATTAAAKEEAEASYGENMFELEAMERSTKETTPCSLINSQMISTPKTPGSTTRSSHSSHRRVKAPPVHAVPSSRAISSREINEYFAAVQRRQQQAFINKYNFDPVNDCPLPGRFEWVKLK